jgi:hypothetical protein
MGRLEDLDLGVVGGEEDLGLDIAAEVGDERRGQAVGLVLDREVLVDEVVPGLPEGEVAFVAKGEDGEGDEQQDAQISLPHRRRDDEVFDARSKGGSSRGVRRRSCRMVVWRWRRPCDGIRDGAGCSW